ncbi:MAG: hypothetical protein Q9164_004863 [Protoblastenia rupestris]
MATTNRPNPFPNAHTILLSTATLTTSPHLTPLIALANAAFSHSHTNGVSGKEFMPATVTRFPQAKSMLDDLGPNGFCLIMFETGEEESDIIGTISAKPFIETKAGHDTSIHPSSLFKRPPPPTKHDAEAQEKAIESAEDPEASKWELLASAVALRVKGKGVASMLLEKCIEEIRRRAAEEHKRKGLREEEGKVALYLSTMQEVNEAYYLRKGWRTTGIRRFAPGTWGGKDGFGIVEMVRVL